MNLVVNVSIQVQLYQTQKKTPPLKPRKLFACRALRESRYRVGQKIFLRSASLPGRAAGSKAGRGRLGSGPCSALPEGAP